MSAGEAAAEAAKPAGSRRPPVVTPDSLMKSLRDSSIAFVVPPRILKLHCLRPSKNYLLPTPAERGWTATVQSQPSIPLPTEKGMDSHKSQLSIPPSIPPGAATYSCTPAAWFPGTPETCGGLCCSQAGPAFMMLPWDTLIPRRTSPRRITHELIIAHPCPFVNRVTTLFFLGWGEFTCEILNNPSSLGAG